MKRKFGMLALVLVASVVSGCSKPAADDPGTTTAKPSSGVPTGPHSHAAPGPPPTSR